MGLFHVGGGVSSFLGQLWSSFRQLGDVWESDSASEAFRRGDLKSQAAGATLRIAFRNATPLPLLLCWISDSGTPHHFYTLHPQTDVLLSDVHVTENDKIETTVVGHCFALACCEDHDAVRKSKTLNSDTIIGGYRATRLSVDSSEDSGIAVHVLTITQSSPNPVMCSPRPHLEGASCWGLRGSNILETDQEEDDGESKVFRISVCEGIVDRTPLDTSDKHYSEEVLGGWPVRVEPGWDRDSPGIRKQMIKDLKAASKCLPVHARVHLQKTTPIYINRSQKYGPELCPVDGRACCFHPHKAWLVENGMSIDKAECVEMYRSSDYMKDRKFWGPGGLILHELSHAYHWKMVEDGYDNEVISKCYRRAMKDGLYDCVSVHGRDKPTKAYACENQMEYFAELSVAFLGGLDKTKEHNKWFPFCRDQLKEHDPRAYRVLQRIWKAGLTTPKFHIPLTYNIKVSEVTNALFLKRKAKFCILNGIDPFAEHTEHNNFARDTMEIAPPPGDETCGSCSVHDADLAQRKLVDYTTKCFSVSSSPKPQHRVTPRRMSSSSVASFEGRLLCLPGATRIQSEIPPPGDDVEEELIEFYLKIPNSKRGRVSRYEDRLNGQSHARADLTESLHSSGHLSRPKVKRTVSFLSRSIEAMSIGSHATPDDPSSPAAANGRRLPPAKVGYDLTTPNSKKSRQFNNSPLASNISIATESAPQTPRAKDVLYAHVGVSRRQAMERCLSGRDLQIVPEEISKLASSSGKTTASAVVASSPRKTTACAAIGTVERDLFDEGLAKP